MDSKRLSVNCFARSVSIVPMMGRIEQALAQLENRSRQLQGILLSTYDTLALVNQRVDDDPDVEETDPLQRQGAFDCLRGG